MSDFEVPGLLSDHDSERAVLGAAMVDNAVMPALEAELRVEHFHDSAHRLIYAAMLDLTQAGRPSDFVTIIAALREGQDLDAAGGAVYVAGLVDGIPRGTNVGAWVSIVREKARRRRAIAIASLFVEAAGTRTDASTDELLDHVHGQLGRLMEGGDRKTIRLHDVLASAVQDLERFATATNGVTGIPTGLHDLDRCLGGLLPGRLYIVAARTSRGKSVLCAQAAVNAAVTGHKVLVFSMEMEPYQLAQRMLLARAEVDRWDLKPESPRRDYAWGKVNQAVGHLSDLPVWFDQREAPNLAEVRASARQHQARHGLDMVVVDYLQRMTPDPKLDRWLAIGDMARGLKSLARSMSVPVVAACQLNADAEEKRPTLASLAQAQSIISAEADVIVMLHPEDLQRWKTQDYPVVNFFVDKNRTGPCLAIQVSFEKACSRFVSMAAEPTGLKLMDAKVGRVREGER